MCKFNILWFWYLHVARRKWDKCWVTKKSFHNFCSVKERCYINGSVVKCPIKRKLFSDSSLFICKFWKSHRSYTKNNNYNFTVLIYNIKRIKIYQINQLNTRRVINMNLIYSIAIQEQNAVNLLVVACCIPENEKTVTPFFQLDFIDYWVNLYIQRTLKLNDITKS